MTQNWCGYQPFLTYTFSVCLTAMEPRLFTTPRPRILAEEFRLKMCVTRKQAYMTGPDAPRGLPDCSILSGVWPRSALHGVKAVIKKYGLGGGKAFQGSQSTLNILTLAIPG